MECRDSLALPGAGSLVRRQPGWEGRAVRLLVASSFLMASPVHAQDRTRPTALEAGIVEELNRVRTDPAGYARHLEALLPLFEGKLWRSAQGLLETDEGAAAVREAIAALRATAPMGPLQRSPGLSAAARDLVRDQGASGEMGHVGGDGSTADDRISRYGRWDGGLSENVTYSGYATVGPRDVVIQLLVDDGVRSRGHRANILDPAMRLVGVACGPHPHAPVMCVMDHVQEYEEGRS
jgi:hypothetical protein